MHEASTTPYFYIYEADRSTPWCKTSVSDAKPDPVYSRLKSIEELSQGWNYGQGEKFSPSVLSNARRVVDSLKKMGVGYLELFPGLNGEILISVYPDTVTEIEIGMYPDETYDILVEKNGDVDLDKRKLNLEELLAWLKENAFALNNLSEQSTCDIITALEKDASRVFVSHQRAFQMAFQSSTKIVPLQIAAQFALT